MAIMANKSSKENYPNKSDAYSDDSIIQPSPTVTPVKKKLKRIRNKAKSRKESLKREQSNETQLLEELVQEFNRHQIYHTFKHEGTVPGNYQNIENKQLHELHSSGPPTTRNKASQNLQDQITPDTLPENLEAKIHDGGSVLDDPQKQLTKSKLKGITEPIQKTLSKNRHSLFVFYLIYEVLEFTPNNFPKNSCVQLIGKFNFDEYNKSHVLCSFENNYGQACQVKLDCREMVVIPNYEEKIILFGVICFENSTPIIAAKFYQQSVIDYQTYVELMLRLRTTVPRENFTMVCVTYDDFKCDDTGQECSEEELFNDLTLSLSGEQVETKVDNYDLSDSELYAFLDDISFENL